MASIHPIGRISHPEEIADAVAWLFSEKSSYYTGQSLALDGGLTAQRPYVTQSVNLEHASEEQRLAGSQINNLSDPCQPVLSIGRWMIHH